MTCAMSAAQQQLICTSGADGEVEQATGTESRAGLIKSHETPLGTLGFKSVQSVDLRRCFYFM